MPTHPLWRPFASEANAARQSARVDHRQVEPGPLEEHRESWADDFEVIRGVVVGAIGDRALGLRHVGSTAIPGVVAKPIIDVDLTVADVEDESAYLPELTAAGFRLIFRDDMGGDPHRQLTFAVPNANLHVWGPGAIEPQRHLAFAERLRSDADARRRYTEVKLATGLPPGATRYNDRKAPVVYDIYERIFRDDPEHPHDARPRE